MTAPSFAQTPSPSTWRNDHTTLGEPNSGGWDVTTTRLSPQTSSAQTIAVTEGTGGVGWSDTRTYAFVTKTVTQPTSIFRYNNIPSGAVQIGNGAVPTTITLSQAMVDNGGVVVIVFWNRYQGYALYAEWVPIESPPASIKSTNPSSLSESNLNGATVTVELSGSTFDSDVAASDFEITGAPSGATVTVSSVTRDSSETDEAELTLSYTGDFDEAFSLGVKAKAGGHTGSSDLDTGTVRVAATVETAAAKPTGLSAAAGNRGAVLTWTDPGDPTITGWEYQYKLTSDMNWPTGWTTVSGSGAGTTMATVTGLTNDIGYDFRVRALRTRAPASEASDSASATPVVEPEASITAQSADPLTESNVGGATVTVTLSNTTYVAMANLNAADFTLSAPSGVTVASVSRTSNTVAVLTLGFTGDFDVDGKLSVTVKDSGHTGSGDITTGEIDVTAVVEPEASITSPSSLTETALAGGATVTVTLSSTTYVATANLSAEDFTLSAPSGVTISGVSRTSDTVAVLTLGFTGDFDVDGKLSVTVKDSGHTGSGDLATGEIDVTAVVEPEASITSPSSLAESGLDEATVTVTLAGTTYVASGLGAEDFTLSAPSGVTISSVSRSSSTVAVLTLGFTGDFDVDGKLSVTVKDSGHTGSGDLATGEIDVTAVVEPEASITAQSADPLTESNVDGATVTVTLSNATYVAAANLSVEDFTLSAPSGVTISSVSRSSSTVAVLTLGFTGDFDVDGKLSVTVKGTGHTGSGDVATGEIDVTAVVEPEASITSPSSLAESGLDEAEVTVTLAGTTYVATGLDKDDFTLSAPSGVTIDGVSRTSDTVAVLTLDYDGTDFDEDGKLKVTVKGTGHTGGGALETGEIDVTAATAPAAPTGLSATGRNLSAVLSWTDPQDAGITGWEYRRKLGSESDWGPWMGITGSGASTTRHTVGGLANGRAYNFEVRALNSRASPSAGPASAASATPAAQRSPGTTVWRNHAQQWSGPANSWDVATTRLLATETAQTVVFNTHHSLPARNSYAVYGCPWTSARPGNPAAAPTGCELVVRRGAVLAGSRFSGTVTPTAEMIANGGAVFAAHYLSGATSQVVFGKWVRFSDDGVAITKTNPSPLTEENLHGAVVTVELSGLTFQSSVAAGDFELTGAPSGAVLAVSSATRDSSESDVADLTLSYLGDYDEAFSLGVRAKANGHTGSSDIETGTVLVAATVETVGAEITSPSSLAETGLAGATVTVTLTGTTYVATGLDKDDFALASAPSGATISRVSRTSGTEAALTLGFTGDFDADAKLSVRVLDSGHAGSGDLTTGGIDVTAVVEPEASITSPSSLAESGLDGATVTVTLRGTTFNASISAGDFEISGPSGVGIKATGGVSRSSDTAAVLTLSYDGTDFDSDGKLKVTVKGTGHAESGDLETGEIDVEAVAEVAPAAPTGLSAAGRNLSAVLSWTDPGNSAITGWEYRYRTSGGVWGSWTAVSGSAADTTEATVGSLANGQAYDFQVRAVVAKASDGAASETVSATPDAPSAAITAQSATPLTESNVGGATVTVTLSRTTYVAGLTSSNFELVNAPAGVGIIRAGRTSDTVAVLTFSQDGTMDFDTDASMSVRVLDSGHAGSGNLDTGTVAVEAVVEVAPSAPLGFRVEAADGAASLTWRDPGDSTIEGWEYRRKLSSGSWPAASPHGWTAVDGADAKNFRVTVTGLTNGSKYDFQLRALRDKAPAGTASATLSVTPSASVGATITATSPFPLTEDNLSGATVTVTLNAVKHANTSRSAGNFRLTGAPAGVGISAAAVGSDDSTTVLTLSYDGTDFDSDGRLGVRILAASHEGSLDIETGETVAITATDEKTPGKPSGLTAAAGDGEVELSWTGLGAAKVSKWEYRYRTSGDPTWGSWTGVTGSVDTTEATVPGLANGQAYEFQVRGFRERASPEAGPASDTATATPVAPGASISSTDPSSLTEENLHGATVTVTLANAAYVSSGLDKDDFSLPSAPSGVTISGVVRNSATEAVLTLAYDGTDLSAAAKLSVRVLASGHQGTGNLDTGEVDVAATSGPEVSGVSVTSSPSGGASGDTYGPGETIEVAVSFTDPRMRVTLTQAGVRPYLELGIGTETRRAEYASVSRNVLRFRYEVVAADADADGISIGHNALAANTAVIGAGRGPRATVAGLGLSGFTVANDGDHKVDGSLSPPARPTGLSAAAGAAGEADLSWTDPQDSGITGWEYRYKTEGSSLWLEWTGVTGSVAGTTSATVDGLSGGQGYVFQVRSRNSDGASPASAESSAVTITGMSIRAASPPLSETGLDGEKIVVTLLGAITFNATLSATDFELVATGVSGVSITGAERRSGNAKAADLTLSYDGSDFDADGKLGVKVKGSAYGGTEELTTVVELSVSAVAEAAPLAIRDFSAYPRDGEAVLSWSHPTDRNVSYEYRYRKSGEAWGDWASLARAVSNTHAVSGLDNGATYEFEFRGRTAKGGEGPTASATVVPNPVEASITGTDPTTLTESNLNDATVTVELSGTTFNSSISASDFEISGLSGLGIKATNGVSRTSATEAELTLAYTGTGIDADGSFSVKVLHGSHQRGGSIAAGTVTVRAVPAVAGVSFAAAPPVNSTWRSGEKIEVDVEFAPAVTVTGTPRLALTVGSNTRQAEYESSGSSSTKLRFAYAVVAADEDTDGISVAAGALGLNGGSIVHSAASGVNAALDLGSHAVSNDSDHKVDGSVSVYSAAITSTSPASLSETNLDNATVTVELTATTYEAAIDKDDFELPSKPPGVTISGVVRNSATEAVLTLSYDDTDFDADAKLRVKVLVSGHAGGTDIETGDVNVSAVAEQAAAKPSGLSAAAGDEEAVLSWTNPSDSLVTGYEYQRRNTGGSWPAAWTEMTGSGAGTTEFTAGGLANGQAYDFRIRALRAKAEPSAASDAASATPVADAASVSSTFPATLTEANLNNSRLTVTLSGGTEFNSSIGAGDFEVSGAPSGVTVSLSSRYAPRRLSATEAHVFLSYGGENFDSDWTLRLAVKSTGHDGGSDLAATVRVAAEDESVALSALSVRSGQGGNLQSLRTEELKPPFVSSTTAYRATAPLGSDTVIITVRPKDSGSKISINNDIPLNPGARQDSFLISQGENTFPIVVTSSGGSQRTYTLVVRRGSANALLSALRVFAITKTDGDLEVRSEPRLSPHFQSAVGSYSAKVAETITKVRIRPLANHPRATITVAGTATANNTMSGLIDLAAVGTAKAIDVVVTPEDTNASAKTYRISITREAATITPSAASVSAEVGTAITSVAFTVGGEGFSPDFWSVDKALPSGLSMDPETGTISGTPRRASPAADYEVRASSAASSVTAFGQTLTHKASATVRIGVDTVVSGAGVSFTGTTGTGSARSLSVNEGRTATYTVALTVQPSGTVTLAATKSGSGDVTINPQSLTFTTTDWSSPKTITVTAASDGDAADDSASIAHEVSGGGYDGAVIDGVAVTVDDDEEVAVKTSLSSLSVEEGSDATYTVTLGSAPTATVTVTPTVSGSGDVTVDPATLTFDGTDWSSPKTVTVSAASDSDAEDDSATITHSVSSSDGNYDGFSSGEVSVTASDTEKADLSSLGLSSGTLSPAFGPKTTAYTASVVNSVGRVTVTAAARVSSATVSITPADADAGTDGHQVDLATQQATAITVKVTAADGTEKDYAVAVTRERSVAPSAFSFTAVTGAEPGSENTSNAITVSGIEAGSAAISVGSGGTLVVNGSDFTGSTVSNGNTVAVKLTASSSFSTEATVTVTIGGVSADFSVTTRAASSNANLSALTLSDGATLNQALDSTRTSYTARVPASVRSKIKVRPTAADSGATIKVNRAAVTSGEESGYIYFPPRGFSRFGIVIEVTAEDGTTKKRYTLRLSRQSSDATLGAVSVYQGANTQGTAVSLTRCVSGATPLPAFARSATSCSARVPTSVSSVTVVPQTSDPRATVKINGSAVTRTATGTLTPTTVTLSGGTTTVSIEVTPEDASASKKTYAVVVTKREVTASVSALTVAEAGGTGNYTVVLDSAPTGTVTVIPASGDEDIATVSGALEFTTGNWSAPQQVTVTGQNDDIDNSGDQRSVTITHSVSGGDYDGAATPSVSVTVSDDDTKGITLSRSGALALAEGSDSSYNVKLASEPATGDVVIRVSSGGAAVTVNKSGGTAGSSQDLTFTKSNWNTDQAITLAAVEDDDTTSPSAVTITHSVVDGSSSDEYDPLSDIAFSVNVTDDDTAAIAVSRSGALGLTEGGSSSYNVKLAHQPGGDVVVRVSSGDTAVTVNKSGGTAGSSQDLTFTVGNWNTDQAITLAAVQDDDTLNPSPVTITHTVVDGSSSDEYDGAADVTFAVNVTDDDAPGLTLSRSGALALAEGSDSSYNVKLARQPGSDVVVRVSSGGVAVTVNKSGGTAGSSQDLAFTVSNWNTDQAITLAAVEDDDVTSPSAVTITHSIVDAQSSDEYDPVSDVKFDVNVTDDDTAAITVSRSGALALTEGDDNTHNVKLAYKPEGDVVVRVSSGGAAVTVNKSGGTAGSSQDLTFTVGNWNTDQAITLAAAEDDDTTNPSSVTVTHTVVDGSSSDEYDNAADVAFAVNVTDDDTAAITVSRSGALALAEGSDSSYNVKLAHQPGGDVVVRVSSGGAAVTVNKSGGTAGSSQDLTFTVGNWDTDQAITLAAAQDDDTTDPSSVTITHTVVDGSSSDEYDGAADVTFAVNVTDDDTAAITVSRSGALALTEGSDSSYNVKLAYKPEGGVVVRVSSGGAAVTVNKSGGTAGSSQDLAFTVSNWNTDQAITLAAVQDDDTLNPSPVTITHTVVDGSSSDEYDGAADVTFAVNVTDDDAPGLTLSRSGALALAEGSDSSYNVKLARQPGSDVVVRVSSGGAAVTVNKSGGTAGSSQDLTFTTGNWDTNQAITLAAVEDDDVTSPSAVTITHSIVDAQSSDEYDPVSDVTFDVNVTDDDTAAITVSRSGALALTEGDDNTHNVKLAYKPEGGVVVRVSSGAAAVTVNKSGGTAGSSQDLTFTVSNWNTNQAITLAAAEDDDTTNPSSVTVTHSVVAAQSSDEYDNAADVAFAVNVTDDDAAAMTVSRSGALALTEGESSSYNVKLAYKPEGGVVVRVSSGGAAVTVNKSGGTAGSSQDLAFTVSNWNTDQAITLAAVEDDDTTNPSAVTITHTVVDGSSSDEYDGAADVTFAVNVTDDDTAAITVSRSGALGLTEGGSSSYNVKLSHRPAGGVVVRVSSDGVAVTVNKSGGTAGSSQDLAFTVGNWNTDQAITLAAVQDADTLNPSPVTITHTVVDGSSSDEYDGAADVTFAVNVTDDDAPGLTLSRSGTLALTEGGSSSYNVKLARQPGGSVVVRVSSGGGAVTVNKAGGTAGSSQDLTFTTGDWDTDQAITLVATEDTDTLDPAAVTITHSVVDESSSDEYDAVSDVTFDVNVTDDDYAGLSIADASASEGSGRLDFAVTLSMASSRTVTVDWALVTSGQSTGTATAGTATTGDYDAATTPSGTLTFSSGGSLTQTISVPINDDFDVEGDETVKVALSNQSPSQVGVSGSPATGTITDDDEAGVSVSPERSLRNTTEDNAGTVEFRVALSSRPTADVTVTVTSADTTEGTVKAAEDDPDPTLAFTPGNWNAAQTVTVTGVDDDELDGDAEYNVRLAFSTAAASDTPPGDANYRGLSPVDVPFTNLDDDLSILSVSGGGEVTEGDSGSSAQAEFTVTLEPERRQEVSVSYATADGTAEAGSDYVASSRTVTFSPGETSKTVAVTINGDDEAEGNETFTLSLTETPNGQIDPQNSSAEAVIVNDDEKMVDASMSGEFSVGDTTVTVDSTLPADTGLEIVLPSELESGGSMIEELTVTLGPTDQEIDSDLFGYTGAAEDHVLVDIDVSPVPDSPVKVCLPITEELARAAGEQRLYLIRFSGGSWEELSSTTEGDMVCASVSGFSPFALVYQIDYAKRRFGEVNRAILPELSRAMTASTLEAVTARIEDAMAGGAPANSLNASAPAREEFGHALPRLRLGEFEDGETISLLDSIDGSRFSVSLAGGYDPPAADSPAEAAPESLSGGLGMWISGDYRSLSGGSGGPADWDGRLISGHMGADYRFGRRFLAGVATSWSQGSFDYTGRGESGRVSGEYGSRMNSFHPYLGLSLSRRLDVWASGGWGFGEIRMDDGEISGRQKAAARQGTLAAGANIRLSGAGATSLSLKGEAWMSRMRVKDNGGRIEGLKVGTDRLRAALEGSHALALGSGSSLVPSLEFGIRRDGGDGETGAGGELGGGITFASSFGLSVEARGRTLLFHQGDTKEWGVGGSVRFDPGGDGRGLSMSALPTYGNGSSGIQTLWDGEKASDFAASGSGREFGLETEVGYGFSMFGDSALLTPYGAFGRPDPDSRNYRFGSRFSMNRSLDLTLEGQRREIRTGTPEHELTVRGRLNW